MWVYDKPIDTGYMHFFSGFESSSGFSSLPLKWHDITVKIIDIEILVKLDKTVTLICRSHLEQFYAILCRV